jgi:tetratricopeptide (TPR) repeat protein
MHRISPEDQPPQAEKSVSSGLQQATGLLRSGKARMAVDLLLRLNRDFPGREDVLRMAGVALSGLGRESEAEALLRERLRLAPDSLDARSDLANVLLQGGDATEALSLLRDPPAGELPVAASAPAYWFNLGRAYKALGRAEDALGPLQRVVAGQPEHFGALITLGDTFKALGRADDAADMMRRAVAVRPSSGTAWWSLTNLKSATVSDEEFAELQKRADGSAAPAEQVYFEFALGKACEDAGLLDKAFAHYSAGNRLRRKLEPWNAEGFRRWLAALREAFEQVSLPRKPAVPAAPRPVFIVSLPRSGSTLTEQILAAHSQVTAASELPWLPKLVAQESQRRQTGITQWAGVALQTDWGRLGSAYLQSSRYWHRLTPVFTDKLPGNFPYVGAILRMLPDALVVNVRRNAMDVCWSCYRQLFVSGSEFSYELSDLASYWHEHDRHMRYWQAREPDRVLNLDYESLVRETETETRRLLDFLDLPFEPGCLRFQEAQRAVNTASAAQVRQAVSTRGIGHWRRFEDHLGALRTALENYP